MREEERVRIPREDLLLAVAPRLEVDVGRRRRRHDVDARALTDAGRVADERDARRGIEVRHVMRRVTWGVLHLDLAARPPTAFLLPRRREGAPPVRASRLPTGAPCPPYRAVPRSRAASRDRPGAARRGRARSLRCGDAARGSNRRRRSDRGGYASPGSGARRRSGCPSSQCRRQRRDRRRRPGIDERDSRRPVQDPRRDDLRTPEEIEIDVVEAGGEYGTHVIAD